MAQRPADSRVWPIWRAKDWKCLLSMVPTALDSSEGWQHRMREKEAPAGDTLAPQAEMPYVCLLCR